MKPWRFIYILAALLLAGYLLCGKQRFSAEAEQPIPWKADLQGTLPNELSELPRMDHAIDSFLDF